MYFGLSEKNIYNIRKYKKYIQKTIRLCAKSDKYVCVVISKGFDAVGIENHTNSEKFGGLGLI